MRIREIYLQHYKCLYPHSVQSLYNLTVFYLLIYFTFTAVNMKIIKFPSGNLIILTFLTSTPVKGYIPAGYVGCFKDHIKWHEIILNGRLTYFANNSGDRCKQYCSNHEYRYAGTEYRKKCFCGNTIREKEQADNCNHRCPGNHQEYCGGNLRISVYDTWACATHPCKNGASCKDLRENRYRCSCTYEWTGFHCDIKKQTTTFKPSRTTTRRLTSTPPPTTTKTATRPTSTITIFRSTSATTTTRLVKSTKSLSDRTDKSSAAYVKTSEGNKHEMTKGIRATTTGFPNKRATAWDKLFPVGYIGCYEDGKGLIIPDRVLPVKLDDSNLNCASKCKKDCSDLGYRYAGTESGEECFCGNKFQFDPKRLLDSDCNIKCPGKEEENCGGDFRIAIYDILDLQQTNTSVYIIVPIALVSTCAFITVLVVVVIKKRKHQRNRDDQIYSEPDVSGTTETSPVLIASQDTKTKGKPDTKSKQECQNKKLDINGEESKLHMVTSDTRKPEVTYANQEEVNVAMQIIPSETYEMLQQSPSTDSDYTAVELHSANRNYEVLNKETVSEDDYLKL